MNSSAKILGLVFGAFAFIFVYDVDCLSIMKSKSISNDASGDTFLVSNKTNDVPVIRSEIKSKLSKSDATKIVQLIKSADISSIKRKRTKRQIAYGGFGVGWGGYDYNSYYGDYAQDYAYDYYDWICSEKECQLCDVLTSECCDPQSDVNCFLPDSCMNNPCMSGGTCVSTITPTNDYKDFVCICLPGLTGKYCQSSTDYLVGAQMVVPPLLRSAPAVIGGVSPHAGHLFRASQLNAAPLGQTNGQGQADQAETNETTRLKELDTTTVSTSTKRSNFKGFAAPQSAENQTQSEETTTVEPTGDEKVDSVATSSEIKADSKAPSGNEKAESEAASGEVKADNQASSNDTDGKFIPTTTASKPTTTTSPIADAKVKSLRIIKPLGAKRIKCEEGKIFSSFANSCVEFALSRTRQAKPTMNFNGMNGDLAHNVHNPSAFVST